MFTLEIFQVAEEKFLFSLKDSTMVTPVALPFYATSISNKTRNFILRELERAAEVILKGQLDNVGQLILPCNLIYSLMPEDIQNVLKKKQSNPLLIQTNDPCFPWELAHDNQEFLSLTRPVGRTLLVPERIGVRPHHRGKDLKVLIVANPTKEYGTLDLPAAEKEAEILIRLFSTRKCQLQVLMGRRATKLEIIRHLRGEGKHGPYDLIHYSGHAEVSPENPARESTLLVAGEEVPDRLMASEICRFLRGYPVVFLNACYSSRGEGRAGISGFPYGFLDPRNVQTLAEAFIKGNDRGGAQAFIGSWWRIGDWGAQQVAEHFYRNLLEGQSLGEALRLARLAVKEANNPTWAAYILYGDPTLKILAGKEQDLKAESQPERRREEEEEERPPEVPDQISIESFDLTGQMVFFLALKEIQEMKLEAMVTGHLFLGMLAVEGGHTRKFVKQAGADPDTVHKVLRGLLSKDEFLRGQQGVSERVLRIFRLAREYARAEGQGSETCLIGEKHLLQAFFEDGGGRTAQLLKIFGVEMPPPDRATILALPLFSAPAAQGPEPGPETERTSLAFYLDCLDRSGEQVFERAVREIALKNRDFLTTPDLFIGLTKVENGLTQEVLQRLGVNPERVREVCRQVTGVGSKPPQGAIRLTRRVADILAVALKFARAECSPPSLPAKIIGEKHLFLGFLENSRNDPTSITASLLREVFKVTIEAMLQEATGGRTSPAPAPRKTPLLDSLGRDLCALAREGKLTPVIGREAEIERLIQILFRRSKNNAILIGEAGVGKTAIVEGLAQRLVKGPVPPELQGLRIVEITAASLVAGTRYRGDFEERLQQLVEEIKEAGNVVLFLDEIHTLIGAGETQNGTLDAANILKPALARGELRCIGATTIGEFRRHVENDPALERRFQILLVHPPSPAEAKVMLQGLKGEFEKHHQLKISPEALEAAVDWAVTYLADRHLPDKALDLLDEAASRKRIQGSLEGKEGVCLLVTREDVAEVVKMKTGLDPLVQERLSENWQSLKNLEAQLRQRVLGQDQAISALMEALHGALRGIPSRPGPAAVLLFLGPVGVGKSFLARSLAEVLNRKLIPLEMGMFSEPHSLTKLTGASPGFAGPGEEGQLTGSLRTYPEAVVLLDDIDRAHKVIRDFLASFFEQGQALNGRGRKVEARNALFVLTATWKEKGAFPGPASIGFGVASPSPEPEAILEAAREILGPDLAGRLDQVILFKPLEPEDIRAIARKLFADFKADILRCYGIQLHAEEALFELLARRGYAKVLGVRPMAGTIQKLVGTPLVQILAQQKQLPKHCYLSVEGDRVSFSFRQEQQPAGF